MKLVLLLFWVMAECTEDYSRSKHFFVGKDLEDLTKALKEGDATARKVLKKARFNTKDYEKQYNYLKQMLTADMKLIKFVKEIMIAKRYHSANTEQRIQNIEDRIAKLEAAKNISSFEKYDQILDIVYRTVYMRDIFSYFSDKVYMDRETNDAMGLLLSMRYFIDTIKIKEGHKRKDPKYAKIKKPKNYMTPPPVE
uniref:Uncharacterized protein n=1 Tax=Clastoptera arizonana TaxID=38151 RepID=A0A1B6CBG8_9HEMI